jgi:hypothetical protein
MAFALRFYGFDDADGALCLDYPSHFQSRAFEQFLKLLGGAFFTAGRDEHFKVEHLTEVRLIAGGQDSVEDQQFRIIAQISAMPSFAATYADCKRNAPLTIFIT